MSLTIAGISAHFHDAACGLLRDGRLVAAAQEERFTRIEHDPSIPRAAFRYCLEAAGLTIADVDAIAYYEDPVKKLTASSGWGCRRSRRPRRRRSASIPPGPARDPRAAGIRGTGRLLRPPPPEAAILTVMVGEPVSMGRVISSRRHPMAAETIETAADLRMIPR